MLKVMVACGNGMGSSMLIKNKVSAVLKKYNIEATIDHSSVGDAMSVAGNYDLLLCPISFESSFESFKNKIKLVSLQNLLSEEEITEKLKCANVIE